MIINRSHRGDFYYFSSLVNSEKKCLVLSSLFLTEVLVGQLHERTFIMGTGGQAALTGSVNNRGGNLVAAMSGPTLHRVFNRE